MTDPRGPDEPGCALSGTVIDVRATPNASRDQVTQDGARYLIRVTCPPEGGRANKAVTKLLARTLRVAPSRLTLVSGETSRDKRFRLD